MSSLMSAQKTAAIRNALAEMLVDYILQRFGQEMYEKGYVSKLPITQQQIPFARDDCSELYDHYLELHLTNKLDADCRTLQIWAQTTCYKGNDAKKPESNKTYEIRETLTEALTLRRWLTEENTFFRTIHFTLGPSDYTYGWFKCAKENAFDLSLYPAFQSGQDLFDAVLSVGSDCVFEFSFYERLDLLDSADPLSIFINKTVEDLISYFTSGYPQSEMADKQASLLHCIRTAVFGEMETAIAASQNTGMNIKGKTVKLLDGEEITDPVLDNTLKRILTGNPFLPEALDALHNWKDWSRQTFDIPLRFSALPQYLKALWTGAAPRCYVTRRLLFRIYTDTDINYIQDLSIEGIDEHNLYQGMHTPGQAESICLYLLEKYEKHDIISSADLYQRLISSNARRLINASMGLPSLIQFDFALYILILPYFLILPHRGGFKSEQAVKNPAAYHQPQGSLHFGKIPLYLCPAGKAP